MSDSESLLINLLAVEATMYIKRILENDWYKTATQQEMRIALMNLEMSAMDRLNNNLNEEYRKKRDDCFEACAEDNGWN